jgi:hypothetical protein
MSKRDDINVRLPGLFRWSELSDVLTAPEPDDEWRFIVRLHSITPDLESLYEVHGRSLRDLGSEKSASAHSA